MKVGAISISLTALIVSLFSYTSSQDLPEADSAKTQDSHVIGASDVIEVRVWYETSNESLLNLN